MSHSHAVTYKRIASVDLRMPSHFSEEAKDLVRSVRSSARCATHTQLLKYNPADRLPLSRVLRHPWIMRHDPHAYTRAARFVEGRT